MSDTLDVTIDENGVHESDPYADFYTTPHSAHDAIALAEENAMTPEKAKEYFKDTLLKPAIDVYTEILTKGLGTPSDRRLAAKDVLASNGVFDPGQPPTGVGMLSLTNDNAPLPKVPDMQSLTFAFRTVQNGVVIAIKDMKHGTNERIVNEEDEE